MHFIWSLGKNWDREVSKLFQETMYTNEKDINGNKILADWAE